MMLPSSVNVSDTGICTGDIGVYTGDIGMYTGDIGMYTGDIGVLYIDNNVTVDTSCGNGDVRLVGGANELEGRVEICYNKMWGSVCHQSWQINDANIICKQLHFQPVGKI